MNILCDIIFNTESLNKLLSLKNISFINDFDLIKKEVKHPVELKIYNFDINKSLVSKINIPYLRYIDNDVNINGKFVLSDQNFSIDNVFIKFQFIIKKMKIFSCCAS